MRGEGEWRFVIASKARDLLLKQSISNGGQEHAA